MSRLVITVDGSFSGPQVVSDPRLNDGSIILIEPGYPTSPITSTAHGTLIPNIAAESAALIFPATTVGSLTIDNTISASSGMTELTDKGGLHVIMKQSGGVASERLLVSMAANLTAALDASLEAGTKTYYVSMWGRMTRRSAGGVTTFIFGGLLLGGSSPSGAIGIGQAGSTGNITTAPTVTTEGRTNPTLSSGLGAFRAEIGHHFTPSAIITSTAAFRAGNVAGTNNVHSSLILYALYIESLTDSGRTYAEASALDAEMYAAATGPGGRYYDDGWTDPLTI